MGPKWSVTPGRNLLAPRTLLRDNLLLPSIKIYCWQDSTLIMSLTLTSATATYIWWLLHMYLQLQLVHLQAWVSATWVSSENLKGNMFRFNFSLQIALSPISLSPLKIWSSIQENKFDKYNSFLVPLFLTLNIQTSTKSCWFLLYIFNLIYLLILTTFIQVLTCYLSY